MKVRVIYNPSANNWRAQKLLPMVVRLLDDAAFAYELSVTNRPKQAIGLARESAEMGFDAVIAAGGDGTISEVVNGLIQASVDRPTLPLGILPIGTGNDLSDMLNLPRDLEQAIDRIASGASRQIDLGQVVIDGEPHYFDNNCALAMEALITVEYNKLTRLSGIPRYISGVIKGLFKLRPWKMQLEWDEGMYEGDLLLCSICNSPRTGSTFLMAPNAQVDDGLFDVVYIPTIPMHLILRLLPRIITGTHLKHPQVHHIRTRNLTITGASPMPVHADGELLTAGTSKAIYSVLAGKLTLLG